MIPQIIMLAIVVLGLIGFARRSGTPRKGIYDFYEDVFYLAINQGLLIWGGFYEALL